MARRALLAVLTLAMPLLVASPASAAVTCVFDEPTGTVTITLANGDVARVVRAGDAITIDGTPCGAATVSSTDTIDVSSTGTAAEVRIDLSGGPFAPGETPETDTAGSEIEWLVNLLAGSTLRIVGGSDIDRVVVGADGINLNAGETTGDVDVVVTGAPTIILDGQAGADVLSVGGGAGTGGPGPIATVIGGADDDRLVAGTAGGMFDGADGSDTIDYNASDASVTVDLAAGTGTTGGGEDALVSIENAVGSAGDDVLLGDGGPNALEGGAGADRISGAAGDDTLDGGAGVDLLDASDANAVIVDLEAGVLTGQGTDALDGFEDVLGSDGADRIDGNGAQNSLDGGAGADRIDGAGGADELKGGTGNDTATYGSSSRGVTVSLSEGTATGAGADTLSGFENLIGSPDDDTLEGTDGKNMIDGRSGADEVDGLDGQDRLVGGNGADLLFGGAANDLLLGGARKDQLNGGVGNDDVCRGGEEPDSFVFCENYRTTVADAWFVELG